MKIDNIDKKILGILQKNAKITNAKLSNEIGLSPAPTLERVRKLETQGIISGYHAKLNMSKIIPLFLSIMMHSELPVEGLPMRVDIHWVNI